MRPLCIPLLVVVFFNAVWAPPEVKAQAPTPRAATLDGLYVGNDGGDPRWYWFKASGLLAYSEFSGQITDPDPTVRWPRIDVYTTGEAEKQGYGPLVTLELGVYQLLGNNIRIRTQRFSLDLARQVLVREEVFEGLGTNKEEPFRALPGLERIQIGSLVLVRQPDHTGRKLAGEFSFVSAMRTVFGTGAAVGTAGFTPDGRFALEEVTHVGESKGTGRYEIRGHEITFYFADGRVERRLLGDLGKEEGREHIVLGRFIYKKTGQGAALPQAGPTPEPTPGPVRAAPARAAPASSWRLFDFRSGQRFTYEVTSEQPGGRARGSATIAATVQADQVELSIEGELKGQPFPPTRTTFGARDLERLASGQWATNELSQAIAQLLFAPFWVVLFAERELQAGARWTMQEAGVDASVEVLAPCTYADVKGLQGKWWVRTPGQPEIVANWCVAPELPLPLMARLEVLDQNATASVTLREYHAHRP